MPGEEDNRLIAEALQGHPEAFGELVCRYQDRLFNTMCRLLGNAEDARDVVQEAFLHAYLALDRFKGQARFFTWLYRIAFNRANSIKRKHKAVSSLNHDYRQNDTGKGTAPLEQAEEERRIQQALDRLSPEHRAVLIMKDMEGHKYEVMAEVLQVPIGTIRSRLHRARLELRALLVKEEERPLKKKV